MDFIWYLIAGAALVYSLFCVIRHLKRRRCGCSCDAKACKGCGRAAECSQKKPNGSRNLCYTKRKK